MKYIQNPEIDSSELNGEKVMMNLDKGLYFNLNRVGSDMWDILGKESTIDEIVEKMIDKYDVSFDECKKEVILFIDKLIENELIKNA